MIGLLAAAFAGVLAGASAPDDPSQPLTFSLPSADGALVEGQADLPAAAPRGVVVLVAGTGAFDRDVRFGVSRMDQDRVFVEIARRLNARGLTAVRYDKRGVRQGGEIDPAVIATATTDAQRDDLGAVYAWARSPEGLNSQCVALFGHSEGMAHIGRLASSGAPEPALVYGLAPLLDSPVRNFRWNFVDRIPWSLEALDTDGDGLTSEAEIEAGWSGTPAAVELQRAHFSHPNGQWTREDIDWFRGLKTTQFETITEAVLAMDDAAPYPTADTPMGVYQWWKSWWLDDRPVADRLMAWPSVRVVALFGDRDSQTRADRQMEAARQALGDRFSATVKPGLGHTLGDHVAYGPMNAEAADAMADEVAASLSHCAPAHS